MQLERTLKIHYTSNLYKEHSSSTEKCSWIKLNNQIKCYCVWSFFERKLLCVHYWWGREEKGVSYRLRFVSSARKQQSNTKPFPPPLQSPPPLSLHLVFPLLSKCSSIQLPKINMSSLTIDKLNKNNHQNINLKAKPTL